MKQPYDKSLVKKIASAWEKNTGEIRELTSNLLLQDKNNSCELTFHEKNNYLTDVNDDKESVQRKSQNNRNKEEYCVTINEELGNK